jgi:hypothetical protein
MRTCRSIIQQYGRQFLGDYAVMTASAIIFLFLLLLGIAFVVAAWALVVRLTPDHRRRDALRWLLRWSLKGMGVPLTLWALMNLGITWRLQPFMPQVQAAQYAGLNWFAPFLRVAGYGVFVITSYWMALTLGWTLAQLSRGLEGEQHGQFRSLAWTCCIGMLLPALLIQLLGGWPILGVAASAILLPLAGYAPGILRAKKLPPMYARAVARAKFGKYAEAEAEIIRELEKCEDDFDGWLMLAELYAIHFNDLAEAQQTIIEICDHPGTNPSQLSVALHKLADWQLKLAGDPVAARRTLQVVCSRLPGTHLARMAQLRINQLPATGIELRRQQENRPIPLSAHHDPLDQTLRPVEPNIARNIAVEKANAFVEALNRNPANTSAREQLARILAEKLDQPGSAIEQLMVLLDQPDQPDSKRAQWLALAAAWHLNLRHDTTAGRQLLERLIREFPESPQFFPARRRLQALENHNGLE